MQPPPEDTWIVMEDLSERVSGKRVSGGLRRRHRARKRPTNPWAQAKQMLVRIFCQPRVVADTPAEKIARTATPSGESE